MEDPDSASFLLNVCSFPVYAWLKPFTLPVLLELIALLLLLTGSALISGSEIAFFSLNPPHMKELRDQPEGRNKLVLTLLENPKKLLATILISNNFINVTLVILSTYIASELFVMGPVIEFVVLAIVITTLILLFGEVLPKMYATRFSLKFARFMSPVIHWLSWIFFPLSVILVRSTSFIDKRLSKKKQNISMSDLSDAIEITSDDTTPEDERKILKGIAKFGDIEVKEIMKSRIDVVAVDIQTTFEDLLKVITESGYSRIPVYQESFDRVEGILYVKDLLSHLGRGDKFQWSVLIRDAFFIPENKKINDLLQEFQEKKIHMAVIVDEYGGTSGIVTLEDIIEEIVGEISDEFDTTDDEVAFSRIDAHNYIFEGKTTINDFCKIVGIEGDVFDAVKGESDSLAGLILEIEGKIPPKETVVRFRNFDFKVLAANDRRIQKIRITIHEAKDQTEH